MSYQKPINDGSYEPINSEVKPPPSKKWIIGALAVFVVAVLGYSVANRPGAATSAAVAKADLPMAKNGKLKLFDQYSKYSRRRTRRISRSDR